MYIHDDEVEPLLDRFTGDVGRLVPLVALWVHGSLALGDFQLGRSDIDLVAIIDSEVTAEQKKQLLRTHKTLAKESPPAAKLHCSYMASSQLADAGRRHLTWAQGKLFDRPVSQVSRRELHKGELSLFGPAPADLLPEVTDQDLAQFIRGELKDYWYPFTAKRLLWLDDAWVDYGLLTLVRATVTLRDGRLVTKGEALGVLAELGAPADVLEDIRRRRYETKRAISMRWRIRRGQQARTFVRAGIERAVALPS